MQESQKIKVSEAKVMHSAAGYYIGQAYYDTECGAWLPFSRLSGYYSTQELANDAMPLYQDWE